MKRPSDEEIKARLAEIDADERFHYKAALIQINAPLALVQVSFVAEARALAWAIGVEAPKSGPRKRKEEQCLSKS
jgi:hypothetical protein